MPPAKNLLEDSLPYFVEAAPVMRVLHKLPSPALFVCSDRSSSRYIAPTTIIYWSSSKIEIEILNTTQNCADIEQDNISNIMIAPAYDMQNTE